MNDFDESVRPVRKTDVNGLHHVQLEETVEFKHRLTFCCESDASSTTVPKPLQLLRAHCNASGVSRFHLSISRFQHILFRTGVSFWLKFPYSSEVSCLVDIPAMTDSGSI